MWFFTSGAFWFVEGILAVLAVIGLKVWMAERHTPMPLWKWLVVGLWMLTLGFTIAFIGTSVGENEMVAAQKGGIIFSVVCIIMGAGVWRLLQIGRVKTAADSETNTCEGADKQPRDATRDEEV